MISLKHITDEYREALKAGDLRRCRRLAWEYDSMLSMRLAWKKPFLKKVKHGWQAIYRGIICVGRSREEAFTALSWRIDDAYGAILNDR